MQEMMSIPTQVHVDGAVEAVGGDVEREDAAGGLAAEEAVDAVGVSGLVLQIEQRGGHGGEQRDGGGVLGDDAGGRVGVEAAVEGARHRELVLEEVRSRAPRDTRR